jgi:hypothetical protein
MAEDHGFTAAETASTNAIAFSGHRVIDLASHQARSSADMLSNLVAKMAPDATPNRTICVRLRVRLGGGPG